MEEVSAFAEDAAENFWEGEDKLAVGSFVADGSGDPCAGLADPALMTGGAEVAGFAGECEELFVAAIRALEAGEPCGEVATPEKCADGIDGILTERPHRGAVVHLVGGGEGVPCVVDNLPEGRCARAAWMVDRGRHGIRGSWAMSAPGGWGGRGSAVASEGSLHGDGWAMDGDESHTVVLCETLAYCALSRSMLPPAF